jgi:hypothetical protein
MKFKKYQNFFLINDFCIFNLIIQKFNQKIKFLSLPVPIQDLYFSYPLHLSRYPQRITIMNYLLFYFFII